MTSTTDTPTSGRWPPGRSRTSARGTKRLTASDRDPEPSVRPKPEPERRARAPAGDQPETTADAAEPSDRDAV